MKYTLNLIYLSLICYSLLSCNTSSEQTNASEESNATASQQDSASSTNTQTKFTILFFGNSLTAGYGLDDPADGFAGLIQQKLDSAGRPIQVINAGLSGETTASGKNRLDWVIKRQPVDIFVLELGANDGLRGISPEETRSNLMAMIDEVRNRYPEVKILLTGMMVPPNMGPEYSEQFKKIYPEIAKEKEVTLMPFLLQDVAGEPDLNQGDGIHPTEEGHQIVAKNVWQALQPLLPASSDS